MAQNHFFVHLSDDGEELDLSTISETRAGAMLRRVYAGTIPKDKLAMEYEAIEAEYAEVQDGGHIECLWAMKGNEPLERETMEQLEVRMSDAAMRVTSSRRWRHKNSGDMYIAHHVMLRHVDLYPQVAYYPDGNYVSVVFSRSLDSFLHSYEPVD
jgi:hypothetical protein